MILFLFFFCPAGGSRCSKVIQGADQLESWSTSTSSLHKDEKR